MNPAFLRSYRKGWIDLLLFFGFNQPGMEATMTKITVPVEDSNLTSKAILLVEDNANDEELTIRALRKSNIMNKVVVARDGEEALDYLFGRGAYAAQGTASSVQLILLDLNLPKTSGLDVLRQIRLDAATRHLAVVILTVSRKEPDLLQSFTMGVSDYLIKPLDPERFVQIYRKYVKEPAA